MSIKNAVNYDIRRSPVVNADRSISSTWDRWMSTAIVPAINNTTLLKIPGPYANDAAAAAAGVAIGSAYYLTTGAVVVRLV